MLCTRAMATPTNGLVELLDLEEIERNIFRGRNEGGQRERLFGGQVAAQALAAAGRTVEGRAAHSLHAYFLRPGDPSIPVLYTVDRIRDGQSFTTRRVVAVQHGQAIFSVAVSFQVHERGYEHQQLEMPRGARSRVTADLAGARARGGRRAPCRGCAAIVRSTCATSRRRPSWAAGRAAAGTRSGSARSASCPRTRSSTAARSPTRRTCRCSTPSSCRTAAPARSAR